MKYYAVTNDPNELMHFGIKGMKWGVRRTDAQLGHPRHTGRRSNKPRSAAYKRASAKLSASMQNGIAKVKTKWKVYNSPAAKEQRFMKKAMQQARNGTLKYGKLTDDQVRRVTSRLALEQDARRLGNTEKPSFGKRLRSAVGEGVISGIGRGTADYIDERFKGRGKTTAEIKADKRMAKYEASSAGQRNARRKANNKINEEYYEEAARRGYTPGTVESWGQTTSDRAKQLKAWKERDEKEAIRTERQKRLTETYDRTYAAERAKQNIKKKYGNLASADSNKEEKKDNNNNGPGKSQAPIVINVNSPSTRTTSRKWKKEERARRAAGRGARPKSGGRNDWHGDLRPSTVWGQQDPSTIPLPGESINAFVERQRRNKRTGNN